MCVVHEAVENGVGVSGIANDLVPGGQRELGGDDRRSAAITLFEDFEQIVTGPGVEWLKAEVVENEEIGAAEGFDQARMATVASRERHVLAELRPAVIEHGPIVAAGFMADGASQPAFADAGWADQGQIVVGVDPIALGELLEQGAIKTSGGAVVGVFDACLVAELRRAQPGRQAFVFPPGSLPVEEQSEPVGVGKILGLIGVGEIGEGLGHSMEAEGAKLVEGRMFEQAVFS